MNYKIIAKPKFVKDFKKLSYDKQKQIQKGIRKLERDYLTSDIKKLKGEKTWRLRIGDYGILFELDRKSNELTFLILLRVKHRKDAYKK